MKTAFITGATGFLGTNIVRQLIELGIEVHALKRATSDTSELADLNIIWHTGDVTNRQTLIDACPTDVDAFFHVAADTSMWRRKDAQQNAINLDGTENAIEAAVVKNAKRFIHTSSIAAYGPNESVITETTMQTGERSFCNYYRTKHLSEKMVKLAVATNKLDAVILNPCHLVGAPDTQNWSQMIKLVKDENLPGVPPGLGSFCDIEEVARAHISAVENGKSGENYILSGVDMSFVNFISLIGKAFDKATPQKPMPAWLLKAVAQFSILWANVTRKEPEITPEKALIVCDQMKVSSVKAQQELGYKADVDIEKSLNNCIQWMAKKALL
jgi:nucleoside-diphosphate-sugar epimerase